MILQARRCAIPLYDYKCEDCKIVAERLVKLSAADEQYCLACEQPMSRQVSAPAKTPGLWADGWNAGLASTGKYDVGLGMKIYNERQRDRELESRGWIRESDLGPNFWDRQQSKIKAENAQIEAKSKEFKENLTRFDGNKELAVSETWKAKDCLAGKFD